MAKTSCFSKKMRIFDAKAITNNNFAMKKFLLISAGVVVVLFAFLLSIPFLFGDKIRAKVDESIDKYINAKVGFSGVKLSLFRNFPNVSVGINDFLISGKDRFEGDTLFAVKNFSLEITITSLFEDKIKIVSVALDEPVIRLKVLKDSTANYDIVKPQPENEPEEAKPFALGIDRWEINNANISYNDAVNKTNLQITELNHEGAGEIQTSLFDLKTKTKIKLFDLLFGGTRYRYSLEADALVNIDQILSRYTIGENRFKINDLPFTFSGFVEMPENSPINMDLRFGIEKNSFKNLLSLIPAIFTKGYEGLQAEGEFAFDGFAKGAYDEKKNRIPEFGINLKVNNGFFRYPDLPASVSQVNFDLNIENKTGDLEKTVIDLKKFALNIGKNPVSGRAKIEGLKSYLIDAEMNAKVNLSELAQVYPMEGLNLKGDFSIDATAKGRYDEKKEIIPNVNAVMKLANGYVKSSAYPEPLEDLTVSARAVNTTGKMADFVVDIEKMNFLLDKDPFAMSGKISNLSDYTYDLAIEGKIDLGKMTKIYPIEGMKVKGIINADILTKGKMSDIDAGRYDKLPTSGKMLISGLDYTSTDLPQGMKVTSAEVSFTPQQMLVKNFKGFLGKSDMALDGGLENYLAYGFHAIGLRKDPVILKGKMNMKSETFDVNEWMTDEETPETAEAAMSVVEVPKDIDFVFNAAIKKVLYDKMNLENMQGIISMKDGIVRMQNLAFATAGGEFVANGSYNAQNLKKPLFDFDMQIKNLSIPNAFQTFTTVQTLAPVAKNVEGILNTGLKISGALKPDMMPDFMTLSGGGLLSLTNLIFKNEQITSGITRITGNNNFSNQVKDLLIKASFENGRLKNEPFDVNLGQSKATVVGSTGMDGSIDYRMTLDVPKQEIAAKLDQWFGVNTASLIQEERIKLDFLISGNYSSPKVELDREKTQAYFKGKMRDAARDAAKETGKEIVSQIQNDTTNRPITEKAKDALQNQGDKLKEGLNKLGIGKKKGGG